MGALFQQYRLMLWKNWLFMIRSKKATAIQLLSPIIFTALIVGLTHIVVSMNNDISSKLYLPAVIPPCTSWNGNPCVAVAYAPLYPADTATMTCITQLITAVAKANHLDLEVDFKQYSNAIEFGEYVFKYPNQTASAIIFGSQTAEMETWCSPETSQLTYSIWYNGTSALMIQVLFDLGPTPPDNNEALQVAIDSEFLRMSLGRPELEIDANFLNEYVLDPVQHSPAAIEGSFDTVFFYCGIMFQFVMLIYNLTVEKEMKLRQALRIIGLKDSIYWASWFSTGVLIGLAAVLIQIAAGFAAQLIFFTNTNFFVTFLLLFVYSLTLIFFAFFVSAFVSTTRQAVNAGMLLFVVGLLFVSIVGNEFVLNAMYDVKSTPPILHQLFSLLPPFNLAKPMSDIAAYGKPDSSAVVNRFEWSDLYVERTVHVKNKDNSYVYQVPAAIDSIYLLLANCVMYGLLAWYCDNVRQSTHAIARPYYFFLLPSYWGCRFQSKKAAQEKEMESRARLLSENDLETEGDEDVRTEQSNAHQSRDIAFRIDGLSKNFVSQSGRCPTICCGNERINKAVNRLGLTCNSSELLALLGHNGAGKSTTINMLTGLMIPDHGDAFVNNISIKNDLDELRSSLGVCPQHDILWNDLTAREHIAIFALMKNVPLNQLTAIEDDLLAQVRLTHVAKDHVSTYSGGMKRRLSVALAFIGNPQIVFLDEPTTGMDPYVRRDVWNMILKQKKGRVIIMTTHSMEEADILGDKIAIMARGSLRCVGSSVHLKNKYAGYVISLVATKGAAARVISQAQQLLPSAVLSMGNPVENGELVVCQLPSDATNLVAPFFEAIERKEIADVVDCSISQTSLEQVFVNVTEQAEKEEVVQDEGVEGAAWPVHSYVSIRRNAALKSLFRRFCISTYCQENIDFYEAVEDYHQLFDRAESEARSAAQNLVTRFVEASSPTPINVDDDVRQTILLNTMQDSISRATFDRAQQVVLQLLDQDVLPRFLKSSEYSQFSLTRRA